jgi:hypothetical protein
MKPKWLIAALIGGIAFFLLAWLVFGTLMIDFYLSNIIPYNGLVKDPPVIWSLFIHGLSISTLLSFIFDKMGVRTFSRGTILALWIGFLITLWFYSFMYASLNLYTTKRIIVDLVVNSLFIAVVGGITAKSLGLLTKSQK